MIGTTILHYKILDKLGEGGMGVVYKAEDIKLKRDVAIKFLPHYIAASEDELKRFEIEAQAAAALNHPNISTIYSIEEYNDPLKGKELFIVMEFIDGKELKTIIKEHQAEPLPVEKISNYAIQIAQGLEEAHEKGIVHRDIKSSNIMITEKGQVKIMDFGLAKMGAGLNLTKVGTTVGTVAYMSPEQALGQEANVHSDIWAFGVVLYEMLAGHLPFEGAYEQSIIYSIINDEPPNLSEISQCPPLLEKIVQKCLKKDVQKRYQNFSEVLGDFQGTYGTNTQASGILSKTQLNIPFIGSSKKRKNLAILSGVFLVIILLALLFVVKPFNESATNSGSSIEGQHLAVLPLMDIGGNSDNKAFCSGLMETLTSKLTQLQQFHNSLWVIPVSEVLRYKINSPGEANKLFGVNLVVTGSLQKLGDDFRLTLNLIDTKNLRQLNSSVIDAKENDLAMLQNKSVISVIKMLNLQLNPKSSGLLESDNTDSPEAYEYYVQGRGYLQKRRNIDEIESAINSFLLAVRKDPHYAIAYSGLAEAYWAKYELNKNNDLADQAVKESELAYKLNDSLAYVNITLGKIHDGTGKYKKAVEDFNRALQIDPVNYDAYNGLASAYEHQGLNDDAERTFKRAISMQPDNWIGYNSLGVFYFNHARYDDAIKQFQKVIQLNPTNYLGFSNLGGMYYMKNMLKEATDMFEKAFKLKQSYTVASNLGTIYYIQGKYSLAARSYEKALNINDHDYTVWGNLGAAYYWAPGERDKAKDAFQHAVKLAQEARKINPNNPDLNAQLGGFYSMVNDREKALEYTKKSLDFLPQSSSIMFRAGTTYEQLGDRKIAIGWIIKAIQNGYPQSEIEKQPELKKLLADPEFKKLLSKVNVKGAVKN